MVEFHVQHGGLSRQKKFQHFFEVIHPISNPEEREFELKRALRLFSKLIFDQLLVCDVAEGLAELRFLHPNQKWAVVSGSDNRELNDLFELRGLTNLFDAGVYGGPDSKVNIMNRGFSRGTFSRPCLFLGDSYLDYISATSLKIDFYFVSDWSEMRDKEEFISRYHCPFVGNLADLLFKS
jgi:phosphoglycolate phosphatase-like HAD superfamily hydrolase